MGFIAYVNNYLLEIQMSYIEKIVEKVTHVWFSNCIRGNMYLLDVNFLFYCLFLILKNIELL